MPRYLEIQFDYLQAAYDYYVAFYGSDVWLRQGLEQSDAVDAYIKLIFSKLVDNFAIGETEKNDILNSSIRPSGITDTDVNNLIDLLNDRSANGLSESDFNTIKSRIGTMTKMLQAIFDETPYDHPYFFWNYYLAALWREMFPPSSDPPLLYSKGSSDDGGGGGGGGSGGGGGARAYVNYVTPVPGEHFYKLVNINNRFEFRDVTNTLGQVDNLILPPNSAFYMTYYKPDSNEIAVSIFRTPNSGQTNKIPVSMFFQVDPSEPDTDGDSIPDIAEDVVGSNPNNADSDGDGVLDSAELIDGGNPLDNRPAATGIIASVPLPLQGGNLIELSASEDLIIGLSSSTGKLLIYDISSPTQPVLASRTPYDQSLSDIAHQGEIGAVDSQTRTPEQTQIAQFWSCFSYTSTPAGHWYEIATKTAREKGLSLIETARLLALANIAMADAGIACWDTKYYYESWRPIQAIQGADKDGNPSTEHDTKWDSLLEAPPHPEYVSGHGAFSGAGGKVVELFFDAASGYSFSTTSSALPGVVRKFDSFAACVAEICDSRLYGGIHFRYSNDLGRELGEQVAAFVFASQLQPLNSKNHQAPSTPSTE
jgi:hypothetical protein